jgi:hypothetical protein
MVRVRDSEQLNLRDRWRSSLLFRTQGIPWLVSRAGAPKIIAVASYGYPLV